MRAILFDLGGTLDGDGAHWLDRFLSLYEDLGLTHITVEDRTRAFRAAERRAAGDAVMARRGLREMVDVHVGWQFEALGVRDEAIRAALTARFVEGAAAALARNARVLRDLSNRGFAAGVVSNGCGNVARLCDEAGLTSSLGVVLDSRVEGVAKPDARLFARAAERLGVAAADCAFVGDSLERDMRPARQVGMTTWWVVGDRQPDERARPEVDAVLRTVADVLVLAGPGGSRP
jgi:putative hydrolase of the HAD superfamily